MASRFSAQFTGSFVPGSTSSCLAERWNAAINPENGEQDNNLVTVFWDWICNSEHTQDECIRRWMLHGDGWRWWEFPNEEDPTRTVHFETGRWADFGVAQSRQFAYKLWNMAHGGMITF